MASLSALVGSPALLAHSSLHGEGFAPSSSDTGAGRSNVGTAQAVSAAGVLSPPAPGTSSPQQVLESVLQSIPLFRSLHPSERAVLRASFELEQFHDGDVLSRGDSEASQLKPAHGAAADVVAGKEGGGDEIFVLVVGSAVVSVPLQPAPLAAAAGAAGALRQPSAKWPSAASPLRRLHAGDFFIRDGLPCGSAVFARGPVHAYVLHPGVLRRLLHWFASARSLEESRHAPSAAGAGAAPAADAPAGSDGSSASAPAGPGGAQQQALAKLHDGLLAAADKQAFCAALRRYKHVLHGMPLPCERERSVKALHRDTDQAFRDLAREHAFLLNGTQISLGSGEHVLELLGRLADAIRLQLQGDQGFKAQLAAYAATEAATAAAAPPQDHGSSAAPEPSGDSVVSAVDASTDRPTSEQSAAAAALEDVVSAVLSDVLIASSRTMTGGDSYSQCHSLFSNPGLVFIAAETGTQAPVDVILRGSHVSIQSVNTYKVCHMATDEEAAADSAARRSQRSSRASSTAGDASDSDGDDTGRTDSSRVRRSDSSRLAEDGSMQVWALLRASITEVIHYAPGVPIPRGQSRPSQRDQSSTDGAMVPISGTHAPAGSAAVAAWKRAMSSTAGGNSAAAGAAAGARGPRASFMSSVSASLGTYAFNLLHRQEKGKVLSIAAAAAGGDGGAASAAGDDAQPPEGLAAIDEGGPTDDGEATPPPAAAPMPRAGQPPIIADAGELDADTAAAAPELVATAGSPGIAVPPLAAVKGGEELSAGSVDSDADGRAITKRASTHLRQLSRTGDACGWSKVVQQELLGADAASGASGATGREGAGHASSSSAQETLLTPGALLGAMPAAAALAVPTSIAEPASTSESSPAAAEGRPEVDAQIATFAFSQFTSESGSSSAPETALSTAAAAVAPASLAGGMHASASFFAQHLASSSSGTVASTSSQAADSTAALPLAPTAWCRLGRRRDSVTAGAADASGASTEVSADSKKQATAPRWSAAALSQVAADVADELSIVIERALEVTVHVLE